MKKYMKWLANDGLEYSYYFDTDENKIYINKKAKGLNYLNKWQTGVILPATYGGLKIIINTLQINSLVEKIEILTSLSTLIILMMLTYFKFWKGTREKIDKSAYKEIEKTKINSSIKKIEELNETTKRSSFMVYVIIVILVAICLTWFNLITLVLYVAVLVSAMKTLRDIQIREKIIVNYKQLFKNNQTEQHSLND